MSIGAASNLATKPFTLFLGGIKMTTVSIRCPFCGQTQELHMTADQYARYCKWVVTRGAIQNVFPDLTADQREQLMTGICPTCWDSLFCEEDE
jgi:hypothetical protein